MKSFAFFSTCRIFKMNSNENNDYVQTMHPVLFLMRITGIIPISSEIKDTRWYISKSILISIFGLTTYAWNVINNIIMMHQDFVQNSQRNLGIEIIVAFIPGLLVKSLLFLIPLTLWTKLQHLRNHWTKWKYFQEKYENILDQKFVSKYKNKFRWFAVKSTSCVIFTYLIVQANIPREVDYTYARRISDNLNISFIYFIVTYWISNCTYVRLMGQELNLVIKKCIQDGKDSQKLKKFATLWLSLYDLLVEFTEVHSLFFTIYFIEVMSSVIFMGYICFNYSYFSKMYDQWIASITFFITTFMIYFICETLHYVNKQVYFKQKEMILELNTWEIDQTMLQSMSRFLDTILMKNSSISFNGETPINRSFFPHAIAIIINYMIILRQFQH